MNQEKHFALEAAKEITIAALGNKDCFGGDMGAYTAEFFETVYNKILSLTK